MVAYRHAILLEDHMHRTSQWISIVILAAGMGAFQVYAEPSDTTLPIATESGPVTVISGGVDLDEAQRMKQASGNYPLRVVFSVPGGNYAVPDEFTLMQGGTAMVKIPSAGPWLLIDVPPGAYTMKARVDDRVLERAVTVSRKGNTVYWQVPDSTAANSSS
jgi:threonine dehydrogenase-like Zn-dependent dehydrogenase